MSDRALRSTKQKSAMFHVKQNSFTNTQPLEDFAEHVFDVDPTGDPLQRPSGEPQVLGDQLQLDLGGVERPLEREAAQLQIVNAPDFTARIAGYKAYDDATTGWIDELGKVSSWSDPKLSDADNQVVKGYVDSFIGTGKQLILYLDAEKTAASAGELESLVEAGQTDEATFTTNWAIAEKAIMGTAASSKTPAALPQITASPDPCASPADCLYRTGRALRSREEVRTAFSKVHGRNPPVPSAGLRSCGAGF